MRRGERAGAELELKACLEANIFLKAVVGGLGSFSRFRPPVSAAFNTPVKSSKTRPAGTCSGRIYSIRMHGTSKGTWRILR